SVPSRTATRYFVAEATRSGRVRGSVFASLQRRKRDPMPRLIASTWLAVVAVAFSMTATAAVPQQTRVLIDRITSGKGAYAADDGAYKVVFPREEATIVRDD